MPCPSALHTLSPYFTPSHPRHSPSLLHTPVTPLHSSITLPYVWGRVGRLTSYVSTFTKSLNCSGEAYACSNYTIGACYANSVKGSWKYTVNETDSPLIAQPRYSTVDCSGSPVVTRTIDLSCWNKTSEGSFQASISGQVISEWYALQSTPLHLYFPSCFL